MSREITKRYLIQGRVQGVAFRAFTREQARKLGIKGYVRNLPTGEVECVAQGTPEKLEIFEGYLWEGPPLARVRNIQEEILDPPPSLPFPFEITY